jgi:hypothetical protein
MAAHIISPSSAWVAPWPTRDSGGRHDAVSPSHCESSRRQSWRQIPRPRPVLQELNLHVRSMAGRVARSFLRLQPQFDEGVSGDSHIDGLRSIVARIPDFESQSDADLDALRIYTGSHEIGEMQEHIRPSSIGENESKAPVGTPPFSAFRPAPYFPFFSPISASRRIAVARVGRSWPGPPIPSSRQSRITRLYTANCTRSFRSIHGLKKSYLATNAKRALTRGAAWFDVAEARAKILKGQAVFIDQLLDLLGRI